MPGSHVRAIARRLVSRWSLISTATSGLGAPEEVQTADRVRLQPLRPDEPREGHGIGGRGRDRIDGRSPARAMVDVVDEAVVADDHPRIVRGHRVWAQGPHLPHQLLAQREVVGQGPLGLVQERHRLVADERCGSALFALPRGGQLERIGSGVV